MRDVLKQLYRGELGGAARYDRNGDHKEFSAYNRLLNKLLECEANLETCCTGADKNVLRAYDEACANVMEYEQEELFVFAFRLGAKMMLEVFSEADGALTYQAD